jgi:hypothetical protein
MTDVENLVLEHLRGLRNQVSDFQQETRERLDRIEFRLGLLEQEQVTMLGLLASDRTKYDPCVFA